MASFEFREKTQAAALLAVPVDGIRPLNLAIRIGAIKTAAVIIGGLIQKAGLSAPAAGDVIESSGLRIENLGEGVFAVARKLATDSGWTVVYVENEDDVYECFAIAYSARHPRLRHRENPLDWIP